MRKTEDPVEQQRKLYQKRYGDRYEKKEAYFEPFLNLNQGENEIWQSQERKFWQSTKAHVVKDNLTFVIHKLLTTNAEEEEEWK